MDIRNSDGGGILGTPLESEVEGLKRFSRLAAIDKIAPTKDAHQRIQQQNRIRREHRLVNDAAIEVSAERDLYKDGTKLRENTLDGLMDDEDRENLRLRKIHRANRAISSVRSKLSNYASGNPLLPFAVASAQIPEIVPKPTNLSVGYQILKNEDIGNKSSSTRNTLTEEITSKTDQNDVKQFQHYASKHQTSRAGLGYVELNDNRNESTRRDKTNNGPSLSSHDKRNRPYMTVGIPIDEAHDMDNMANVGFEQLDSTEDKLQQKLTSQKRKEMESNMKRIQYSGSSTNSNRLFDNFETVGILDSISTDDDSVRTIQVSKSFVKSPYHNFANDQFLLNDSFLPEQMQEEYDRVNEMNERAFRSQHQSVELELMKATKKREQKLAAIRKTYSNDLYDKFVPSSSKEKELSLSNCNMNSDSTKSGIKTGAPRKPNVGESHRTTVPWTPTSMLRKRFGVTQPEQETTITRTDQKNEASDLFNLQVTDDDEFRLNCIIRADGTKVTLDNVSNFVMDDDATVITAPHLESQTDYVTPKPSTALYRSIYSMNTNSDSVNGEQKCSHKSAGKLSPSDNRPAILNRNKASDFF